MGSKRSPCLCTTSTTRWSILPVHISVYGSYVHPPMHQCTRTVMSLSYSTTNEVSEVTTTWTVVVKAGKEFSGANTWINFTRLPQNALEVLHSLKYYGKDCQVILVAKCIICFCSEISNCQLSCQTCSIRMSLELLVLLITLGLGYSQIVGK